MSKKQEDTAIQVWTPSPFEGSDLLPVNIADVPKTDLRGREHVEVEDLILPQLQLLQGQSDAVTSGDVEGATPGKFYLTSTQEVVEGPIRVLLCAHTKSRALFPKDGPAFAGVEKCISKNGVTGSVYGSCDACKHRSWRDGNLPPLCSESHNFVALTPFGPAVMRFARTSFKTARMFLTSWTLTPKPLWAHPTVVFAKKDSKEVGGKMTTFYKMEMRWLQKETIPPAAQDAAAAVHDQVSAAHEAGKFGSEGDEFDDSISL